MLLTVVAGVVMGPVGGFVASAVEAAAWGDFEGAAVVGALGPAALEAQQVGALQADGVAFHRQVGRSDRGCRAEAHGSR